MTTKVNFKWANYSENINRYYGKYSGALDLTKKVVSCLRDALKESELTGQNKTALYNFIESHMAGTINGAFSAAFAAEIQEWEASAELARSIISANEDISELRAEIEQLKKEKQILEEKYANPNSREAILLWKEMVGPYTQETKKREYSEQTERNAILSAGKIISAIFGGQIDREESLKTIQTNE